MSKLLPLLISVMFGVLIVDFGRADDSLKPSPPLGEAGKLLAEYKFEGKDAFTGSSRALTVSPTEEWIAVTALGGAKAAITTPPVRVFRLKLAPKVEFVKGPPIETPPDYKMYRSTAFSPDGKILAVSSQDEKTKKWDDKWAVIDFYRTADGVRYKSLHREKGPNIVMGMRFSPDGKGLVVGYSVHNTGNAGSFGVWDLAADTFREFGKVGTSYMTFNEAGTQIATSDDYDGFVQVWDMKSGKQVAKDDPLADAPVGAMGGNRSMSFGPDGKMLFSASAETKFRLRTRQFDLAEQKRVDAWQMPTKDEPDAKRMMQGGVMSRDGTLMLTNEEVWRDLPKDEQRDTSAFAELIDLKTRQSLVKIATHTGRVTAAVKAQGAWSAPIQCVYLSRNARFIVTVGGPEDGSDTRLKVWATGLTGR